MLKWLVGLDLGLIGSRIIGRPPKIDIAIITIKQEEFNAVINRFPGGRNFSVGGRWYYSVRVTATNGVMYRVAVGRCTEQGNAESHALTAQILEHVRPAFLLIVGIGGGIPADEYTLGDVIVSTYLYDLQVDALSATAGTTHAAHGTKMAIPAASLAGHLPAMARELGLWFSEEAVTKPRPPVVLDDDSLYYGDDEWKVRVKRSLDANFGPDADRVAPIVTDGPILSSNHLVKDAAPLSEWLKFARDAKAIDMELAGVCTAMNNDSGRPVPFLAIRGLSDVVGYRRAPAWTAYACETAASFALALIRSGAIARSGDHTAFRWGS